MLQATFHWLVLSAPGELFGAAIYSPGDGKSTGEPFSLLNESFSKTR